MGNLLAKIFHDDGSFDGINIHRNVENFIDVNKSRDPTSIWTTRITINVDSAAIFGTKSEVAGNGFLIELGEMRSRRVVGFPARRLVEFQLLRRLGIGRRYQQQWLGGGDFGGATIFTAL